MHSERAKIQCSLEDGVPDWIVEYPETLAVFQRLGIEYTCGGRSLEFACRERGYAPQSVLSQLFQAIDATRADAGRPTLE